jgi:DNA-binding NtrC family response regulator
MTRAPRHRRLAVQVEGTLRCGAEQMSVRVVNVSESGVGLRCDDSLPARGADVRLEFTLPRGTAPIVLEGNVAWSVSHDRRSEVGVHITPGGVGAHALQQFVALARARVVVMSDAAPDSLLSMLVDNEEVERLPVGMSLKEVSTDGWVGAVMCSAIDLPQTLQATAGWDQPSVLVCVSGDALPVGADDLRVVLHPLPSTPVRLAADVRRLLETFALRRDAERLAFELESASATVRSADERPAARLRGVIGESLAMQQLYAQLERVSRVDTTVVLLGETGVGKGLLAKAIHEQSPRARRPLVTQNCAAVAESLLDSELFGHVRGAFTGAVADRSGLFEVASGGTVFLDEVAEMSFAMQAKLLNVLQDGEVRRVGAAFTTRVDVRVVCATHASLQRRVKEGRFREDLYYRLASFVVEVPPLRERRADIDALAAHFLAQFASRNRLAPKRLSVEAAQVLRAAHWPGNVRQLQHTVERMAVLAPDGGLLSAALAEACVGSDGARAETLPERVNSHERAEVAAALERAGGVIADAARVLGVDRSTLSRRLRKLGLR